MATMAARARANQPKQESDIFSKCIKSGLKDLDANKQELKKSLGAKAQEAKDQMIEQAAEQHDKSVVTSSNDMNQHKQNVPHLVSNKPQEPHDAT
jgi:F0F1-type ATP synthase membrane subunit b/b'